MNIILEELTDEQKKYVRSLYAKSGAKQDLPHDNVHDDFFEKYTGDKNADKMILPYSQISSDESMDNMLNSYEYHAINNVLSKHGYVLHDYVNNVATQTIDTPFGKKVRNIKIGKVLQNLSTEDNEIPQRFIDYHDLKVKNYSDLYSSSEFRKAANKAEDSLQIVISRHRNDIGGMSTGRDWDSCMTLPNFENGIAYDAGQNHKYIIKDFKHHTLVAYLTKKGDNSISEPLGRTLIKKFVNTNGHEIYRPSFADYGNINRGVSYILSQLCKNNFPAEEGNYHMHPDLYPDNNGITHISADEENSGVFHEYTNSLNTPRIISHSITEEGSLHSNDGKTPSLVISHKDNNNNALETHYIHKHGMLHSDNNDPTLITYKLNSDGTKSVVSLRRHFYGLLHSTKDELPSREEHTDNSVSKVWHKYGEQYVSPYYKASKIEAIHDNNTGKSEINIDMTGTGKTKSDHIEDPISMNIVTKNNDIHIKKEFRGNNFKGVHEAISYVGDNIKHSLSPKVELLSDFTHIPVWDSEKGYTPVVLDEDKYVHSDIKTYDDFKQHVKKLKMDYLKLNEST